MLRSRNEAKLKALSAAQPAGELLQKAICADAGMTTGVGEGEFMLMFSAQPKSVKHAESAAMPMVALSRDALRRGALLRVEENTNIAKLLKTEIN
jgi:hypothetical protein